MLTTETIEQIIDNHPFWNGLNPSYLYWLHGCAKTARHRRDEEIFHAGEEAHSFYLIHQGKVSLETHAPGRGNIVIQTLGPGEVLGWSWLFPPHRWHFTARALEETEMVALDAEFLRQHAAKHHEFGYELLMRIGRVMLERLQATRLHRLDFYDMPR